MLSHKAKAEMFVLTITVDDFRNIGEKISPFVDVSVGRVATNNADEQAKPLCLPVYDIERAVILTLRDRHASKKRKLGQSKILLQHIKIGQPMRGWFKTYTKKSSLSGEVLLTLHLEHNMPFPNVDSVVGENENSTEVTQSRTNNVPRTNNVVQTGEPDNSNGTCSLSVNIPSNTTLDQMLLAQSRPFDGGIDNTSTCRYLFVDWVLHHQNNSSGNSPSPQPGLYGTARERVVVVQSLLDHHYGCGCACGPEQGGYHRHDHRTQLSLLRQVATGPAEATSQQASGWEISSTHPLGPDVDVLVQQDQELEQQPEGQHAHAQDGVNRPVTTLRFKDGTRLCMEVST
jgi:hypothetical protein